MQATDCGQTSKYTFVLLFHSTCDLLLCTHSYSGSGHGLTAGAKYVVLLGDSPTQTHHCYSLGSFTGCAGISSTPAVFSVFVEAAVISGWGWAARWASSRQCHASGCSRQWGVRRRRREVLLWAHSLASQGSKVFLWKHQQHGWDLFGAQSPAPARWRLVMRRWRAQPATGGVSVPACCGMIGNPVLFSCFAVKKFLFWLKDFFHSLHLLNKLSSFLFSLLIRRLDNTFISVLGVDLPSVLRVSYTRAAAG